MTRKEIVTNTCGFGGLFGAIVVFIVVFICHGNDPWYVRLILSFAMMIISPGCVGVVLGAVAFILTLPFYRYLPWDVEDPFGEKNTGCLYCNATLYKKLDYNDSSTEFCDDDCEGSWMRGDRVFSSDDVKEMPIPISDRFEILDL